MLFLLAGCTQLLGLDDAVVEEPSGQIATVELVDTGSPDDVLSSDANSDASRDAEPDGDAKPTKSDAKPDAKSDTSPETD
ncbi:MAG: hypothetical protein ACXVEF_20495 [Polyangiales bacterium]